MDVELDGSSLLSHLRSQRQLTFASTPINSAFTFMHIFLLLMLVDCSIKKYCQHSNLQHQKFDTVVLNCIE
jgi:hypothetical protein